MDQIILSELFKNNIYIRKVLPFLKDEYFDSSTDKILFKAIKAFVYKYRKKPTFTAIASMVEKKRDLDEDLFANIGERLNELHEYNEDNDLEWLIDSTEEFCQAKAFENAVIKCANIMENGGNRYSAKEIVQESLKVNFDRHIGIEFFDPKSIEERFKLYNKKNRKFKTHIDKLNIMTGGGLEEKCLHVFLGDTHVGKTMTMSSLAAGFVNNGYDVLYITLEMAEEKISKLIDANLLDIKINDVQDLTKEEFISRHKKQTKHGRLFIREYPTTTAGVSIFRSLLDDLKYKKEFVPQIIIVDYINIMKCDRYSDTNSYTMVKGISEELRGLAGEGKYCIVSATQTNREGAKSSDVDMTDTAESYGLPQTVDLLVALMSSDTLREKNILVMKGLKNRLSGTVGYKFPLKTSFEYARLLDCDPEHENLIQNDSKNDMMAKKEKIKDKLKSYKVNNYKQNFKTKPEDELFT